MDGNYGQNQNRQDPNLNQQNRNWQGSNLNQQNRNWQYSSQNQPNQNWQNPNLNQQNRNWQNRDQNIYYNGYNNGQSNNGQPSNRYPNMNSYSNPIIPNQGYAGNNGYNNYVPYGYSRPIIAANAVPPKTGALAVGSLVCGIISLIGFWSFVTLIAAIVGVVLGVVNNAQDNPNKGMAVAGIILNIVGFLLTIFFIVILMQI